MGVGGQKLGRDTPVTEREALGARPLFRGLEIITTSHIPVYLVHMFTAYCSFEISPIAAGAVAAPQIYTSRGARSFFLNNKDFILSGKYS